MSRHKTHGGSSRPQRVADQIQKELALLVQQELKDPRVGMITIADVTVSRDFAFANVYYTVLHTDGSIDHKETQETLERAAGFLRTELGHMMKLRAVPKLRFHYDETVDKGRHVSSLIEKAVKTNRDRSDDTEG